MNKTNRDLEEENLWDDHDVNLHKGNTSRNTYSNNSGSNGKKTKKNGRSNFMANEYKDTFHLKDLPRSNNKVNIYYGNEEDIIDCAINEDDDIFGSGGNTSLNKNLTTVNLSEMKRGGGPPQGISNSNGITNSDGSVSVAAYYGYNLNNNTGNPPNFSTGQGVTNQIIIDANDSGNRRYHSNNKDMYHQRAPLEQKFNAGDVHDMNFRNAPSGKMNIFNLSDNENNDDWGVETASRSSPEGGENNSFDLFPFFKGLNQIRTKLLCYYDVDSDVIIYRCMCALLPYLNVDKSYDSMDSLDDLEKHACQPRSRRSNKDKRNVKSGDKNYGSSHDVASADENEVDDENAHIRKISNVNDAFDYYDNKLSIERNPDLYGFVWVNIFISFTIFFLFNWKNIFFGDSSGIDFTPEDDITWSSEEINNQAYITQNKLNILYTTLIFLYLFNTFTPLSIYMTNFIVTKRTFPIRLSFLISLMSYNNIILFPLILFYKFTLIKTSLSFILFFCSSFRFFIFAHYMLSSLFYIHKYTIRTFRNNFSDNIIYAYYGIFSLSYLLLYLLLRNYIFSYL
ncbi:conserved Plasmodium protein, unknown function [Plasmodium knowlesi strain H]|uniref:Uncharacterized protein n=3 Tax=Plasmodium knowlesi TaxID=5850 RepID=A0A5K1VIG2_PLAKH|nr:conserved Plasmodium protein, unknown function [Plasmodium knowlesi strain H]OTN68008.1 Uncharacterized protein PKNOH_S04364800 [Plasmodium knowlesi]CAA9987008.1 conserved Plasmodium protein, unknown function [Plasmodium knowlesi strain H]SBO26669.1 conserved Plasmodium protein, unknown function [Plasmodium knowlesi strain H]SBO28213.1 conserved Plasmodium protein, unknown function [Plasmodium knowlesi strain H]VVS76482.1 conserved Plasmodium protein, unknown function [Plasmodium knowlesi s|eukprot:XP_002258253.1 hypothetical protein, conserved in Plasmodium species [Plasmodium knowlesi strain H]